jgi:geranylgeranyl pyrophosphate synthase
VELACDASTAEINALAISENLSLAYQIRDDLSDVKDVENIILKATEDFRGTLPMIHLCEVLKAEPRMLLLNELTTLKSQSIHEKKNFFEKLQVLLQKTGTLSYCQNMIDKYVYNAIQSIELTDKNIYRDYLYQIAASLRF